ncbi:MAG TPA: peroxide stress protein YaaA [Albitalea sp.]|uniref:peroxide stress protein YaaA n=1 Tax=Piscinibacter sp. TaxID=1903157 RepID=UPI002ED6513E
MLFVLSPAKSLDYDSPVPIKIAPTTPQFIPRSVELIDTLKTKSVSDVAALMDLSDSLATLNVGRYAAWSPRFTAKNSKPAVFAFNGDVYDGLAAATLSAADLAWAQEHVAILSGLHGVLRPFDRLQPYRLEMGTPLATAHGRNLYDFWGDTIAEHLNARVAADKTPVIVNLASQEYFRAADRRALAPRVIECVFEDWKGGRYKVISFFAKKARGLMARYAIRKRIATPRRLEGFDLEGYAFAPAASDPDRLVFRRRLAG